MKILKTQGKNSKHKQKTQGFGKFGCNLLQKSTEMTNKQGGTTKIAKSRTKHSKHYRMGTILKQNIEFLKFPRIFF